jgi:formylglycine-generating enzyme required for sulfatase activity
LAGSAWEWTLDYFRDYPDACQSCAEVERGSERVLRGGAFLYGPEYLDPSYRYPLDPQLALGDVGFRCAYQR